jgi:hypothetical protein
VFDEAIWTLHSPSNVAAVAGALQSAAESKKHETKNLLRMFFMTDTFPVQPPSHDGTGGTVTAVTGKVPASTLRASRMRLASHSAARKRPRRFGRAFGQSKRRRLS